MRTRPNRGLRVGPVGVLLLIPLLIPVLIIAAVAFVLGRMAGTAQRSSPGAATREIATTAP